MADPRVDQVTVRELLNHTSGITDAVVPDLSRAQPSSPREATTSLRSAHLASTPGTSYSYANPNYQVAARLVEAVSGEPFGRYLRRHILEPAHMSGTTSTVTDDQPVPSLAEGHLVAYGHAFASPRVRQLHRRRRRRCQQRRRHGSLADRERERRSGPRRHPARLQSRHGTASHPDYAGASYALGWGIHGPNGAPTRLEHSGSLFTFTAEEALWPASGYGVVLLFNAGSPMMLDQIAIEHGVFDIVEGTTPPARGPRSAERLDTTLALLTLAAMALGASGVVRARRWAGRRAQRRRGARLFAALGVLPSVVVIVGGAAFPRLAEAWIGRDVTWRAAAYEWPALVVFVAAALVAAAGTLAARSWRWCRVHRATKPSPPRPPPQAGPKRAPSRVASPAN